MRFGLIFLTISRNIYLEKYLTEKKAFILKCNLKPSLKGVGAGNLRNSTLKLRIFEFHGILIKKVCKD